MTIEQMRNNIIKLQQSIRQIGVDTLIETKQAYIDLNIDQLKHGERSDGSQIGRYKSSSYALYKYRKNTLAGEGNIDLIDTNAFIDGFDIVAHGTSFEEFSHDEKYTLLTGNYGREIMGLQDDNLSTYRHNSFFPSLMPKVRNILNG